MYFYSLSFLLYYRFHIMVYLTALLAICLLVELMVGLDFAVRAFGKVLEREREEGGGERERERRERERFCCSSLR
jgi:hypothetical protein